MTIALTIFGQRYDNAEPAFALTKANRFYYCRIDGRLYGKRSTDKWMAAQVPPKVFGTKEVGVFSPAYLAANLLPFQSSASPPILPPTAIEAPITASVTKAPTATADDTGEVTIAGGPADKAYTVNLVIKGEDSVGEDIQNVAIPKTTTAIAAAGLVKTASSDPNVTATVAGAVITFTPKAGKTITKLTVSVT